MRKQSTDILNGFDEAIEQVESMDVPGGEKKRLIKEWLRSRLAKLDEEEHQECPSSASS